MRVPRVRDAPKIQLRGTYSIQNCIKRAKRSIDTVIHQQKTIAAVEIAKMRNAIFVGTKIVSQISTPNDLPTKRLNRSGALFGQFACIGDKSNSESCRGELAHLFNNVIVDDSFGIVMGIDGLGARIAARI